jgi:hypothetical protein
VDRAEHDEAEGLRSGTFATIVPIFAFSDLSPFLRDGFFVRGPQDGDRWRGEGVSSFRPSSRRSTLPTAARRSIEDLLGAATSSSPVVHP